jgi:hypothetical protein
MKEAVVTTETLLDIMNNQLAVIDEQDKTIADLQGRLNYTIRQKFAFSSEKFPSYQQLLFEKTSDIKVEEESMAETLTFTRKKRGNKNLSPELLPHI